MDNQVKEISRHIQGSFCMSPTHLRGESDLSSLLPIEDTFNASSFLAPKINCMNLLHFIGSLMTPAVSDSPPVQKPALHADTATLFTRHSDGTFKEMVKFPCDEPGRILTVKGQDGKERYYFTSDDGKTITRASEDGQVETQYGTPCGDGVFQMQYSKRRHILYARGGAGIYALDPDSGKTLASYKFEQFGYNRRILLDSEENLYLADNNELKVFDDTLSEKSTTQIWFRPDSLHYFSDGSMMLFEEGCDAHIVVISPDKNKIIDEHHVKLETTVLTDDGKLFFLRSKGGSYNKRPYDVVRYDPFSGKIDTFSTTKQADKVIPRSDGSFLIFDDKLARPSLISYSSQGDVQWNFSLKDHGFFRQILITPDEKYVYVLFERYFENSEEGEHSLYQIDLSDEGNIFERLSGSILPKGHSKSGELIFKNAVSRFQDRSYFLPQIMTDGRIVIITSRDIILLSGDGREEKRFASLGDLLRALPQGEKPVARAITIGLANAQDIGTGWEALSNSAREVLKDGDVSKYKMPQEFCSRQGSSFSSFDKTFNIVNTVDEATALQNMGLSSKKEIEALLDGHNLLNLVLTDTVEIPFHQDPTAPVGRITITRNSLDIEAPVNGSFKKKHYEARYRTIYTTVLPVTTGKRSFVFAGTDDGILHWYDGEKGEEKGFYDLGAGIKKITIGKDNRIFAVTANNEIFSLQLLLDKDESLYGPGDIPDCALKNNADSTIVEEDECVIIDGIKLDKKKSFHE